MTTIRRSYHDANDNRYSTAYYEIDGELEAHVRSQHAIAPDVWGEAISEDGTIHTLPGATMRQAHSSTRIEVEGLSNGGYAIYQIV